MKLTKTLSYLLTLATLACFAAGCGDGNAPDTKIEEIRAMEASKVRKIFDGAGGDYSKVSATDKAAFEKYAGGATKAEVLWNGMKQGSAGSPASGPAQ